MTACLVTNGWDENEVLRLSASLESGSEHPLADAIVKAASKRNLALSSATDFEALAGHGVKGQVEARQVVLGNLKLMLDNGVEFAGLVGEAEVLAGQAQTVMYVAVDGQAAGIIAVADPVKSDSKQAIERLHAIGLKVVMVTGDHPATAEAVAKQVGVDEVMAGVLPQHKADKVAALQQRGEVVGMVGDGMDAAEADADSEREGQSRRMH